MCHHKPLLITSRSWIQAIHEEIIFWKNLLKNKEIVFENGVKNIQAAAYNGAPMVLELLAALTLNIKEEVKGIRRPMLPKIMHYWFPSAKPIQCHYKKLGSQLVFGLFSVHLVSFESQNLQRTPFYDGAVCVWQMETSSALITINVPSALRKFYYIEKEGVFYTTHAITPIFYTLIMYWGMHHYILRNINNDALIPQCTYSGLRSFTIIENPQQIRNW